MSIHELSDTLAGIVERHGASVVRIESNGDGCHGGGGGTGTVWSEGRVLTAAHLVDDAPSVGLPDGSTVKAKVVGRDPGTDVALLEVDAKGLVAPAFVELDDAKVGHLTISLGRPGKTVRAALGMIGTLGDGYRTRFGGRVDRYLQADGGFAPGFAGGPLFDLDGRVLGMNTPAVMRGVALTVPTATLKRVVDELASHGRIRRGYLGVGVAPVRIGASRASVIVAIEPGGPAERAGLLVGDVILSIEGQTIEGPRELAHFLADRIDVEIALKVLRAGKETDVKAKTATRP